jgi:hypothetical protein
VLALAIINESAREGAKQIANLLPVEEATKAGSLSTLPSLKRSLGPSELSFFSINREQNFHARATTQLVPLASVTIEC